LLYGDVVKVMAACPCPETMIDGMMKLRWSVVFEALAVYTVPDCTTVGVPLPTLGLTLATKLMALLAAWLGLPGALLAFGLGVVLGSLVAVVLLAVPSARRDAESWALSKLPLGTFLCIGGIVSSLWGQPILSAYLRWAGF